MGRHMWYGAPVTTKLVLLTNMNFYFILKYQLLTFFQLPESEKIKTVELFTTRRNQYRIAALTCKKAGDIQQAKQFLAVSKVKERKELTI